MVNNFFSSLTTTQFSASCVWWLFIWRIVTSSRFILLLFEKSSKTLFVFLFPFITRIWLVFTRINTRWNRKGSLFIKILFSCFNWRVLLLWTWRNSFLFIFFWTLMSYVIWSIIFNSWKSDFFFIVYWLWLLNLCWFLFSWSWLRSISFFFWFFLFFFIWFIFKFIILVNKNFMFGLFQNWSSRFLRGRLFLLRCQQLLFLRLWLLFIVFLFVFFFFILIFLIIFIFIDFLYRGIFGFTITNIV